MPNAARMGDGTVHGGVITFGATNVLIENMPAARIGDFHTCPLSDGPKPHVGGPIIMGCPTVLIGGLPAARVGDQATCVGPPDTIRPPGALKVQIGLTSSPITCVVVGNPALGFQTFPGEQNYENCYPQSIQQVVRLGTGKNLSESQMEKISARYGYTRKGGTPIIAGPQILKDASGGKLHGSLEKNDVNKTIKALHDGKGVVAVTDAGVLWNDPRYRGGGHAVHVTGALTDKQGKPIAIIINDTGTGNAAQAIPAERFQQAIQGYPSLFTKEKVW